MGKILFDQIGEKFYELGVSKCVLFVMDKDTHNYKEGVAWNGITSISETPEGADKTDIYADNIKYASFRALETFGGTIEAYTYPDEFAECDGSISPKKGLNIGQQGRKTFALAYKTQVGSDIDSEASAYKIHIIYGCTCSPTERSYETINDSPESDPFSWEFDSTPVPIEGYKDTSIITLDSRATEQAAALKTIEDMIYETGKLPMPADILKAYGVTSNTASEVTPGT